MVIRPGSHHNHLWVDPPKLVIQYPPFDILQSVTTDARINRMIGSEILIPNSDIYFPPSGQWVSEEYQLNIIPVLHSKDPVVLCDRMLIRAHHAFTGISSLLFFALRVHTLMFTPGQVV